jgi:hypothetical protein
MFEMIMFLIMFLSIGVGIGVLLCKWEPVYREYLEVRKIERELHLRKKIWENEMPQKNWSDGLTQVDMSLPKTWRA